MTRPSLLSLAAVAALASPAGPLRPKEAAAERLERSGMLTRPSRAAPAAIARDFLVRRGIRARGAGEAVVALRRGTLVKLALRHRGLPVFGGAAAVRLDPRGRVRWARARRPAIPDGLDTSPALSEAQAIARARTAVGAAPRREAVAALHVYALGAAAPRLAYRVDLGFDPARLSAPRVWIDAGGGEVLASEERVFFARPRAHAYEVSPVETPELGEVTLEALEEGAAGLENGELVVYGCPDTATCSEVFPGTFLHTCEPTALALPDEGGDYLHYTFESDTARDDAFSEVQAFWHASRALDRLDELGLQGLREAPHAVIVNWKKLGVSSAADCGGDETYEGDAELEPFSNAMFAPGGAPDGVRHPRDALVFGQGNAVDFAYDGDVVYHELGHAVTEAIAPDLTLGFVDEFGFDPTPAGMHEAFADFVTLAMTGDPEIGEYIASGFSDRTPRTLESELACPADLVVEPHQDSLPLSGAIFAARERVDDRDAFDRAVFTVWRAMDETADFPAAAFLLTSEVEVELGAEAAAIVQEELAARGVSSCDPRVLDGAAVKERFTLPGAADETGEPMLLPGPFQIRYELSERAEAIAVEIALFDPLALGGDALVVLRRGEPILWRDRGAGWEGDFEVSAAIEVDEERRGRASLSGPFEPGIYHLMLVNRGVATRIEGLGVTHIAAPGGGCGCQTQRPAPLSLALLLLALTLLGRRRSSPPRSPPLPPRAREASLRCCGPPRAFRTDRSR